MKWYGLFNHGKLVKVIPYRYGACSPSIFDFNVCFSSRDDYEIKEVEISIK